jgi:chitin synthase
MASTPHHQANLVALPAHTQSDTGLTSHIASRYHAQLPVSNLSSQAIVSINTYTSSSRGPNGGKEGSAMGSMEELASRIWTRLGSRQENQAAVYLYVTFNPIGCGGACAIWSCMIPAHSFSIIKRSFILTTL